MKSFLTKYYLILIIISPIISFPQGILNWEVIDSPTSKMLHKMSFINNKVGWIEGEGGTIINTSDGGESWNTLYTAVDTFMLDIFFLNENLGWVLFWDLIPPFTSKILKTTDGGLNWVVEFCPGENTFFQSVYFLDSTTGFLAGSDIFKTSDGGANWFEVHVSDVDTIPPNYADFPVKKIDFYNNAIGYACGGRLDLAGVMWWTKDGGENWLANGLGPDPFNDINIFDSLNVIGLGGDPEGFYGISQVNTYDGGINWTYKELEFSGVVNAVSFRTQLEGWAAKDDKFLYSIDGGAKWIEVNTPSDVVLQDLVFTDSTTGFAVGSDGTILKYLSNISNVDDLIEGNTLEGFSLMQNHPNPFNPVTKINYYIPEPCFVTIKVYDILSNEISTLVNEERPSGNYEIAWYPVNLPSGIYFYQMKAFDPSTNSGQVYVNTKKMLIIK